MLSGARTKGGGGSLVLCTCNSSPLLYDTSLRFVSPKHSAVLRTRSCNPEPYTNMSSTELVDKQVQGSIPGEKGVKWGQTLENKC